MGSMFDAWHKSRQDEDDSKPPKIQEFRIPKIISVPEKHKETLKFIVSSLIGGAAHKAGGDLYQTVKNALIGQGVEHQGHEDTSTIPKDHHYWEHK